MWTEDQARVIEVVANVAAKFFLAFITGLAFAAVVFVSIIRPSYPAAATDGVVGTILVIVFKHYFPAKG